MWKAGLIVCAAAVLGSWALVASAYAKDGGGTYGGATGGIVALAVGLTVGSGFAIVGAWRSGRGWPAAGAYALSVLAIPSILVIIGVIEGRG